MRFSFFLFLLVAAVLLTPSCKKMPNGGVPFYVRMDSAVVRITNPAQGDSSSAITDVWIEANADNLGAYEMPCNYPVLAEPGPVRFVVSAGIYESGQAGVRVQYPFYEPDTFILTVAPPAQYVHQPVFRYKNATAFTFVEDFKIGSKFDTTMHKTVTSGNNTDCGVLAVTAADSSCEAAYSRKDYLPAGQEIWLEFDYKAEVPFYAGMYVTYPTSEVAKYPVLFVTPKDKWTKMYLKFSNYVGSSGAQAQYNVYFEALRPYGSVGGHVYFDNIKLVHF